MSPRHPPVRRSSARAGPHVATLDRLDHVLRGTAAGRASNAGRRRGPRRRGCPGSGRAARPAWSITARSSSSFVARKAVGSITSVQPPMSRLDAVGDHAPDALVGDLDGRGALLDAAGGGAVPCVGRFPPVAVRFSGSRTSSTVSQPPRSPSRRPPPACRRRLAGAPSLEGSARSPPGDRSGSFVSACSIRSATAAASDRRRPASARSCSSKSCESPVATLEHPGRDAERPRTSRALYSRCSRNSCPSCSDPRRVGEFAGHHRDPAMSGRLALPAELVGLCSLRPRKPSRRARRLVDRQDAAWPGVVAEPALM